MNLITEFRDYDGNVIADFDTMDGAAATIIGNTLIILADNGEVLGRARMELDHGRAVWRLFRGRRGHEIGVATDIRFSI